MQNAQGSAHHVVSKETSVNGGADPCSVIYLLFFFPLACLFLKWEPSCFGVEFFQTGIAELLQAELKTPLGSIRAKRSRVTPA